MPVEIYKEIKKLSKGKYIPVPEFLRDVLRQHLYSDEISLFLEKDFSDKFKREILRPWLDKN